MFYEPPFQTAPPMPDSRDLDRMPPLRRKARGPHLAMAFVSTSFPMRPKYGPCRPFQRDGVG